MLSPLALGLALQLAASPPPLPEAPRRQPLLADLAAPALQLAPRAPTRRTPAPGAPAQDVEYSDWYYRRLDVHRYGSYVMLLLFLAQYYAGTQLEQGGEDNWAEDAHPLLAGGVAVLFASNTVTGVWNLWEGRKDPNDRKRRFLHAGLMLLADAGFVATGILADEAEDRPGGAGAHKTVALSSMAVATLGYAIMLDVFRPD